MKMTLQTPPTSPIHPTTETQLQPLSALEQNSLITTKYNVISNNKQGHATPPPPPPPPPTTTTTTMTTTTSTTKLLTLRASD